MRVIRQDDETVLLSGIDPFFREIIKQIPIAAEVSEDDPAHDRIFPAPMTNADATTRGDWKAYVEPELRHLFQSAVAVVKEDIAPLQEAPIDAKSNVQIPVAHLWSWINALNQARLALAARHNVTEKDMEEDVPDVTDLRSLAVLQIELYGHLQGTFLMELERPTE